MWQRYAIVKTWPAPALILLVVTLLAMAGELHGRHPRGVLVSIRGYDFEFGEGLSDRTAEMVPQATERILALVRQRA